MMLQTWCAHVRIFFLSRTYLLSWPLLWMWSHTKKWLLEIHDVCLSIWIASRNKFRIQFNFPWMAINWNFIHDPCIVPDSIVVSYLPMYPGTFCLLAQQKKKNERTNFHPIRKQKGRWWGKYIRIQDDDDRRLQEGRKKGRYSHSLQMSVESQGMKLCEEQQRSTAAPPRRRLSVVW